MSSTRRASFCGAMCALMLAALMMALPARAATTYDQMVLNDGPVMFLTGENVGAPTEPDATGHGHDAVYLPVGSTWSTTTLPNGDRAPDADGATQYMEVPDDPSLSVTATGSLTVEAWVRPDVLEFTPPYKQEGTKYVHWLGKGESGQQEYAFRMYSYTNDENPSRPNRVSAYQFNLTGGLGVGGYFQGGINAPPVDTTAWIHVAAVYTCSAITHCPDGAVKWYRDGVLKQTVGYTQTYATLNNVGDGTSPMRIFTRDFASFFPGGVAKTAIYGKALTGTQIARHYSKMCPSGGSTPGCSAP